MPPVPLNTVTMPPTTLRSPDILHIGYPKTASTWLFDFFSAHPGVYVDRKAKAWANLPDGPSRSPEDQQRLDAASLYVSCGEKVAEARSMKDGADWNALRFDPGTSERIDDFLDFAPERHAAQLKRSAPDAKVVVCVRDQVDWLISAYRWYIDDLPPGRRSFAAFCDTPEGQILLRAGCYDLTLTAYMEAFGPDRVLLLRFEDLKADRQAFLARLHGFTGLEPLDFDAPPANTGRSGVTTLVHRRAPWLGKVPLPLRRLAKPALEALSGRLRTQDVLSKSERDMLRGFYVFSNQRTRALVTEMEAARSRDEPAPRAAQG